jgi:hypothetical protein
LPKARTSIRAAPYFDLTAPYFNPATPYFDPEAFR